MTAVRQPVDIVRSDAWGRAVPAVSVVIATHNRAEFLPELLAALAAQVDAPAFEVVIADDGSSDSTWPVLRELVAATQLPVTALRLLSAGGPSVPRNTAVAASRGALLAFTDDDCLPTPGWLAAVTPEARVGHVVQGPTEPMPTGRIGTWDRTIAVSAETGLWESCNLALPRLVFDAVGGFPELHLLRAAGRGFGEDTVLGARAARLAGGAWASDAVVQHRWIPGDYASHLAGMHRLVAMPALIELVPELRSHCYGWLFRSRRSAACDAAVIAVSSAIVTRRRIPLLAAVPWLVLVTRAARTRWGHPVPIRIAQEAAADLVGAVALVRGSVAARTPLL